MANVHVLPLFIVYLGLWTAYSTPPFRLKSVPVADFAISGIGAGFLPFLIGGGLTEKLISNIPSIMLGAMPLMLIHCGGHIIQAVGDYEADRKTGVHTFVHACDLKTRDLVNLFKNLNLLGVQGSFDHIYS